MPRHHIFLSRHHPGTTSASLAFARAFVRPLAAFMLPVMIVTLVLTLQQLPIEVMLYAAAPAAVALAASWTIFRLQTTLAEIHVRPGAAAARTVWETLASPRMLRWEPILDLRRTRRSLELSLGHATYELHDDRWPDADGLLAALQAARDHALTAPDA